MNQLQKVFNYEGNQVRTVMVDGEPWFVAKDVCGILDIKQVVRAVERLDSDEVSLIHVTDSLGRTQEAYAVNEPGLYTLVLGSRKPEAKAFKRWVTHEVLPSIRETGMYIGQKEARDIVDRALPHDYMSALKELITTEEARLELELANRRQAEIIAEQQPIVARHKQLTESEGLLTGNQVAKLCGLGHVTLYKFLRREGFFLKGQRVAAQRFLDAGYCITVLNGRYPATRFTIKGLDYVCQLLQKRDMFRKKAV